MLWPSGRVKVDVLTAFPGSPRVSLSDMAAFTCWRVEIKRQSAVLVLMQLSLFDEPVLRDFVGPGWCRGIASREAGKWYQARRMMYWRDALSMKLLQVALRYDGHYRYDCDSSVTVLKQTRWRHWMQMSRRPCFLSIHKLTAGCQIQNKTSVILI